MKISKLIIVSAFAVLGLAQCAKESDQESLNFNFNVTPLGKIKDFDDNSELKEIVNSSDSISFLVTKDFDATKSPIRYEIVFGNYFKRNIKVADSLYSLVNHKIKGEFLKDTFKIKYTPLERGIDVIHLRFFNDYGKEKTFKYLFNNEFSNFKSEVVYTEQNKEFFEFQKVSFVLKTSNLIKNTNAKYYIRFDSYETENSVSSVDSYDLSLLNDKVVLNKWYPIDEESTISIMDKEKGNKTLKYSIKNESGNIDTNHSIKFKVKVSSFKKETSVGISYPDTFLGKREIMEKKYYYKLNINSILEYFSGNEIVEFKIDNVVSGKKYPFNIIYTKRELNTFYSKEIDKEFSFEELKDVRNDIIFYNGNYVLLKDKNIDRGDFRNGSFYIVFHESIDFSEKGTSPNLVFTFKTNKGAILEKELNFHLVEDIEEKKLSSYSFILETENKNGGEFVYSLIMPSFPIVDKSLSLDDYYLSIKLGFGNSCVLLDCDKEDSYSGSCREYEEQYFSLGYRERVSLKEFSTLVRNGKIEILRAKSKRQRCPYYHCESDIKYSGVEFTHAKIVVYRKVDNVERKISCFKYVIEKR